MNFISEKKFLTNFSLLAEIYVEIFIIAMVQCSDLQSKTFYNFLFFR